MKLLLILLLFLSTGRCIDTDLWDLVFTDIQYLTIGNSSVCALQASVSDNDGFAIMCWNNTMLYWTPIYGRCYTLSMSNDHLYCINNPGNVFVTKDDLFSQSNQNFEQIPPTGYDIKASTTAQVWFVSKIAISDGYIVYRYDYQTKQSTFIESNGALKIGPSPDGNAWITTKSQAIQKYNGTSWTTMPGSGTQIVVGSDGVPVILTNNYTSLGYTVQRWNSSSYSWNNLTGIQGTSIALDVYNTPYVVTGDHQVYRLKGNISTICPSTTFFGLLLF